MNVLQTIMFYKKSTDNWSVDYQFRDTKKYDNKNNKNQNVNNTFISKLSSYR